MIECFDSQVPWRELYLDFDAMPLEELCKCLFYNFALRSMLLSDYMF
jgi:hypothetical protein